MPGSFNTASSSLPHNSNSHSASTSLAPSNALPTSIAQDPVDGKGLDTSDKIALGVGLGVGLLAAFIGIPGCIIAIRRRKVTH